MFKSKYNLLLALSILVIGLAVVNILNNDKGRKNLQETSYSQLLDNINNNKISKATILGNTILAETKDHKYFKVNYPYNDPNLLPDLKAHNVTIWVKKIDGEQDSGFSLSTWLFIIFFIALLGYFFSRNRGDQDGRGGTSSAGGNPFNFGKSKARMISPKDSDITFEDVAGVEEAKEELAEIVEFLKDPGRFKSLGAKIPKGCLLVGSPGNGKTLLARAVSGEAAVPFFIISGSDFVEMFVGVGASRVRSLFERAKRFAPCIVFIDEIDAVGRHRGAGLGGGNDEREQTLNQLLVEMDGFSSNSGIIVIAATNRPDVLDPALLRPGRFDRQITIPYPDILGREQILNVYLKKVPLAGDVKVSILAKGTTGFSGADLANMVNEAALYAAKMKRPTVTMDDLEKARDRVIMGSERKSMKLTQEDKELTAYHEAGHTVVALNVTNYHPLHKVSIIPRGRALGVTAVLPEKDQLNYSYKQLEDQLAMLFGGRIAEELIYGKESITTGASNDIQVASNLARKMVTEWGYNSDLGPIRFESNAEEVFLGHSVTQKKNISENTLQKIDQAIREIISTAERRARQIIESKKDDLELITQALLIHETLTAEDIESLLKTRNPQDFKVALEGQDSQPSEPLEPAANHPATSGRDSAEVRGASLPSFDN